MMELKPVLEPALDNDLSVREKVKDLLAVRFCIAKHRTAGTAKREKTHRCRDADKMDAAEALDAARRLEERAVRYYTEAAVKIKAQPEVARALKLIGKKHSAHLAQLGEI